MIICDEEREVFYIELIPQMPTSLTRRGCHTASLTSGI